MGREFLQESVRDSLISQSKDGQHQVWGGFAYVNPDVICFAKVEEIFEEPEESEESEGGWRECGEVSCGMNVLEAKMFRVELEQIIRHASHPWNKEWRLVQLRWEPTITIRPGGTILGDVGVDGARMLLKQLNDAIISADISAKLIESYQERAREDEGMAKEWDACQN